MTTIDAILKFVLIERGRFRAHLELPHHLDLDDLVDRNLAVQWEGRMSSTAPIRNVKLELFTCANGEPGAVLEFHRRDWPQMQPHDFRLRHEPVRLHLEPMQPELFHEEHETVGAFINHRLRRDSQGIRRGSL